MLIKEMFGKEYVKIRVVWKKTGDKLERIERTVSEKKVTPKTKIEVKNG